MVEVGKAFNAKDPKVYETYFSPTYVDHVGDAALGMDVYRNWWSAMWKAFPDLRLKYEVLAVAGDLLVGRLSFTGTNSGPYLGKPATGKRFEVWGLSDIRIREGKFVEEWSGMDELGLRVQLGLLPNLG